MEAKGASSRGEERSDGNPEASAKFRISERSTLDPETINPVGSCGERRFVPALVSIQCLAIGATCKCWESIKDCSFVIDELQLPDRIFGLFDDVFGLHELKRDTFRFLQTWDEIKE